MKKEKITKEIRQSFLYQKCSPHWWPALDTHLTVLQYKKGTIIFKEGEKVPGIYFLVKGLVKVHKQWAGDKELIIRFAIKDDILGHRGLSTHSLIYPIGATAIQNSTICFIDLPFFHSTLQMNPGFMYEFMMFFADELMLSEQRMQDLAHMQVKGRIAKALLALEAKIGISEDAHIPFALSRQDLAAYTGTSYETVYKFLLEFSGLKLIKTTGKSIIILDHQVLKTFAGQKEI